MDWFSQSSSENRRDVSPRKLGSGGLLAFGLFLFSVCFSVFLPSSLKAATYTINATGGLVFSTQSSKNAADVGTNHITIDVGDTIDWVWTGDQHSVTSSTGTVQGACSSGDTFDTAPQNTPFTFSHTFASATPAAKDCKFFCQVHSNAAATAGMVGFIKVEGAAGSGPATVDSSAIGFFHPGPVPDLAVASGATKKLKVYQLTAGGAFLSGNPPTPSFSMDLSNLPMGMVAGNFTSNTDAFDDIIILEQLPDTATVLAVYNGNGAGQFPTTGAGVGNPNQLRVVLKPDNSLETITSVVARDVNGDGKTDLIVTLARTAATPTDPEPRILLGNGNGTFLGDSPLVGSVTVAPTSTTIASGQHQQFTASALTPGGDPLDGLSFVWESSLPGVCSVNQSGMATGVSVGGPANITATAGGVVGSASCTVVVPQRDANAFQLSAQLGGTDLIVTTTVFNGGNVKLDSVLTNIYLSPDNVITGNGNDIFLFSRTDTDLQPAQSNTQTQPFAIPGAGIPTGTYFVGMFVDPANAITETNEGNNKRTTPGTYKIGPDLKTLQIIGTPSGTNFVVSDTQQNIGSDNAGPFVVKFYFSPIANPNPATDTLIGSRSLGGLGAGSATDSASSTFPVPPTTPTGNYFICAISDANNSVSETDETNNKKCTNGTFAVGPDLRSLTLSAVKSGTTFFVTDTQQNIGNVAAGPFKVAFYLSLNTVFDAGDIKLVPGERFLSGLAGGSANDTLTTTHSIPSGTPAGNYFIIAVSDADAVVIETNEANNTRATSGTFAVAAVP